MAAAAGLPVRRAALRTLLAAAVVVCSAGAAWAQTLTPQPAPMPPDTTCQAEEARPPDPLRLHVALAAFMAAQGADLATTMYALGTQEYDEGNKAFDWLTHEPWLAGATKMAVATGFSYLLLKHHRQHPRLTFWLAVAGTAAYTATAIHNAGKVGPPPRR